MSSEFKIVGIAKAISNIETLEIGLLKKASAAVQKTIIEVAYAAKQDAPVDLGELRQSINTEFDATKIEGVVSVNAKHAPYVEFGTGGLVEIPEGFSEVASTFRGKGVREVNLPARPFLIANATKAAKKLDAKLKRLLR